MYITFTGTYCEYLLRNLLKSMYNVSEIIELYIWWVNIVLSFSIKGQKRHDGICFYLLMQFVCSLARNICLYLSLGVLKNPYLVQKALNSCK
jgi:hypothetical protein